VTRLAIALLAAVVLFAGVASAQPGGDASRQPREMTVERLADHWRSGPLEFGEVAATTSLLLALALLALCLGGGTADVETVGMDSTARLWLVGGIAVLAWSFLVRFVLTAPNILTDGGSGYGRVMRYVEGYGGVAVLVKMLPAEWSAFMWRAMTVPRALAALSPALLVWVARGLGLGPAVGLLAGLALASVPAHAVLSNSDHLEGAMSSLQLGGLALVLAAHRRQRVDLFAAGVALAAWAMWCRPEGALGFLPIAAAALFFPRGWWRRWEVLAVGAALVTFVGLRAAALATSPMISVNSSPGVFSAVAWSSLLFSTVLVPYWLWAPAPFSIWLLRPRRALVVALAGLAAGLIPVYLRALYPDPANTHLEALRYGVPAMPWLAFLSAVALDAACRRLALLGGAAGRWSLFGLRAAVAIIVVSPVALHGEYLARQYGHATSEQAIRQLLAEVPAGCGVLVPDDFAEGVSIEIYDRYVNIAAEMSARGELPAIEVRPASELLQGKVDLQRCWTFLRGPYCYHSYAGRPAIACEQLEARFELEQIAAVPIEFRHHRLVSGPDVRRAPWFMEAMPIVLSRVVRPTQG